MFRKLFVCAANSCYRWLLIIGLELWKKGEMGAGAIKGLVLCSGKTLTPTFVIFLGISGKWFR